MHVTRGTHPFQGDTLLTSCHQECRHNHPPALPIKRPKQRRQAQGHALYRLSEACQANALNTTAHEKQSYKKNSHQPSPQRLSTLHVVQKSCRSSNTMAPPQGTCQTYEPKTRRAAQSRPWSQTPHAQLQDNTVCKALSVALSAYSPNMWPHCCASW